MASRTARRNAKETDVKEYKRARAVYVLIKTRLVVHFVQYTR